MAGTTVELAERTLEMSYDDLPPSVVHKAKQLLVDCLGCGLAGGVVDRSRIALELVRELGGTPRATIIGHGRSSSPLAAYANGELINALDFDALGPSTAHILPYVLPPTLAVAEDRAVDGRELLTALVMAIEIGGRAAKSVPGNRVPTSEPPHYEVNRGFTYALAIFGAVAGAGRVLGMGAGQLAHAFGIAGYGMPAPSLQKWQHKAGPASMMKYGCSTGLVAQSAVTACLLAEKGLTADEGFLDGGEWGLQRTLAVPYYRPEAILQGLGQTWSMDAVSLKAFPCCGVNHTSIQALMRVLDENSILPEEIEEIVVMVDPWGLTPSRSQPQVATSTDAQFSGSYITALIPFYGAQPSPSWQMESTRRDPRVLEMMSRVRLLPHPRTAEVLEGRMKAGGWITFKDAMVQVRARGQTYVAEEGVTRGSAQDPLTDQEIRAKYLRNATYSAVEAARAEKAMDMVYQLEAVEDISEMMALLRA